MDKLSNIKGKRIKQSGDKGLGIKIAVALFLLSFVVVAIITKEYFVIIIPLMLFFAILPKSGKTLGVLADGKIYYSAEPAMTSLSEIRNGKKYVYCADGWVRYYAINEIKFEPKQKFWPSTLKLIGDDFELEFRGVGERLVHEIEERKAACRDFGTDGPRSVELPEYDVVRDGIWGELYTYCEEHTAEEIVGTADAKLELWLYPDSEMNAVDLLVTRGERELSVMFEEGGVTLDITSTDDEMISFGYEETSGLEDVLSRVREFVAENL